MRSQIERNCEILFDEIEKLSAENMTYAVANRLSVCNGAYDALMMVKKEREEHHSAGYDKKSYNRRKKMDKETAEEWACHMENEDGTRGPHWTMEKVEKLMEQRPDLQEYDFPDVFAVINMMYSDYCEVAKKLNVNNIDFYVCMTKAWLDDEDAAAGSGKTAAYYEYVVK